MSERSESNRITALHGFLGLPSDWDFLRDDFDIVTPPLDSIPPRGDVLLGYSLGGRLALQALLAGAAYKRAVIVSARVTAPEPDRPDWSPRFASEDWEPLMRDWNAQPIFGGHVMPRNESEFDRRELVRQLREWAPSELQGDIAIPMLFIAGERDPKYVAEARRAAERWPRGEAWICPGAAHRVPWEQPRAFADRLRRYVDPD